MKTRHSLTLRGCMVLFILSGVACIRTGSSPTYAAIPDQPAMPTPFRGAWPALDHEPQLGVLLQRGPNLRVRLLQPCTSDTGDEIAAGNLTIRAVGTGMQIGSQRFDRSKVVLTAREAGPVAVVGSARFSGKIEIVRERGDVLLIERVGMERWLAGVLTAEMHPNWPIEALAAQAIVARSYAASRWQARFGESWQLMRGTSDIAYDGAVPPSANITAALARSRGLLLVHAGQAILARFHACSGGQTEDSVHLWPNATLPDGTTPLAHFMRAVPDPASAAGAKALGWSLTHESWKVKITNDTLTRELRAWSDAIISRPRIRNVHSVSVAERHPNTGRVARVAITHRDAEGERTDIIDALDFRLAVGANLLRSLWWERCVMTPSALVVEGHGFGHGVGLPQVSAWQLAQDGIHAEDIVARYYFGATLTRLW